MPNMYTHHVFAKEIREKLKIETLDDNAFYLGAQGGDLFYLYDPIDTLTKGSLGLLLHQKNIINYFNYMKDVAEDNNIIKSYIIGYITHYTLDTIMHPFILYKEDEYRKTANYRNKKNNIHYLIEANLDFIIYNKYYDVNTKLKDQFKICDNDIETIYSFYKDLFLKKYNRKLSKRKFRKSIKRYLVHHYKFNRMYKFKVKVARTLENLTFTRRRLSYMFPDYNNATKFFNLEKNEWYYLNNLQKKYNYSLYELFEIAIEECLIKIKIFFESEKLEDEIFNLSFKTGLKI